MNTYERTITNKWNLPLEKAIQVEALSYNLDSFTQKNNIIKLVAYKDFTHFNLLQREKSHQNKHTLLVLN